MVEPVHGFRCVRSGNQLAVVAQVRNDQVVRMDAVDVDEWDFAGINFVLGRLWRDVVGRVEFETLLPFVD